MYMSIVIAQKEEKRIVFYADTQSSRNSYKDEAKKIDKCGGFTFGVAGDLAYLSILKFFLEKNKFGGDSGVQTYLIDVFAKIKKFSVDNEVANLNESEFLIAYKDRLFEFSNFALIPREIGFIGSGSNVARVLVDSGISPQKAIVATAKYDVYVNDNLDFLIHDFS